MHCESNQYSYPMMAATIQSGTVSKTFLKRTLCIFWPVVTLYSNGFYDLYKFVYIVHTQKKANVWVYGRLIFGGNINVKEKNKSEEEEGQNIISLLAVNFQEIFLIHSHWHFQRLLAGKVRSLGHLCCHMLPLWKVLGKGDIFLSHCQKRSLFLPSFLWCILFNITNRLLN